MLDVGREILTNNPAKLYVFTGTEYGVKEKYIELIQSYYSGNIKLYDSAQAVFDLFRVKRVIPLQPALYVVRYDTEFLKSLNDTVENNLKKLKVIGTVVLIYQESKDCAKAEKYLPNYTVSIDGVGIEHMIKYVKQDCPNIPDNIAKSICEISTDYGQARNIAKSISLLPTNQLNGMSKKDLMALCGKTDVSKESQFKTAIASKNYNQLVHLLESYQDDLYNVYYHILSTMVDLDRLKSNSYINCEAKPYVKFWTIQDIYYMFSHTYDQLRLSRQLDVNVEQSIVWLFTLLRFDHVPTKEELK